MDLSKASNCFAWSFMLIYPKLYVNIFEEEVGFVRSLIRIINKWAFRPTRSISCLMSVWCLSVPFFTLFWRSSLVVSKFHEFKNVLVQLVKVKVPYVGFLRLLLYVSEEVWILRAFMYIFVVFMWVCKSLCMCTC